MCVVVAARRHPLHKCAMMQPRGCGSRDVPRTYRQPEAHSRRHLSVLRMGPCRGLGWSVSCAHGLCQSEAQSAAPPHFATPTRPFSLSRRSKPSPSPRSAAFMAGGARSLARCLLALAASGGGSVVVCRLKANTHKLKLSISQVSYFATSDCRRLVGAENGVPAPLMAHRAVTGSCSLARRPRARQTGWFARARVAVR